MEACKHATPPWAVAVGDSPRPSERVAVGGAEWYARTGASQAEPGKPRKKASVDGGTGVTAKVGVGGSVLPADVLVLPAPSVR